MDKLTEQLAEALRKFLNISSSSSIGKVYDCAEEALAAYDAAKANGGWLPIESAPKDGTRIIALSVDGDICCAEWRRISYGRRTRAIYGWYVPYSDHDEQGGAISLDSLLWQPLPPPPEQTK